MSDLTREMMSDLGMLIRDVALESFGSRQGRAFAGKADSGDITFNIDRAAEEALSSFIDRCPVPLAYYSEDQGLIGRSDAAWTLVVDPIDGTRSANAGLESCCVSIAAAPGCDNVKLGDVCRACVVEIKSGLTLYAASGEGVVLLGHDGERLLPERSSDREKEADHLRWSLELCGRPSGAVLEVMEELVDLSSLGGGIFVFNSSCYSITRLVTGQLDAYVDIGAELLAVRPELEPEFRRAGRGEIMGIFPYDIAAAWLIAGEAGCKVTDAAGRSLEGTELTQSREPLSCVAAADSHVHGMLIDYIGKRLG